MATMKRQIMSGRVLEKERERGWEELEYLNNLAPCGWDDRSVILEEGPAAREMRGCNETYLCVASCESVRTLCVCCSSSAAQSI